MNKTTYKVLKAILYVPAYLVAFIKLVLFLLRWVKVEILKAQGKITTIHKHLVRRYRKVHRNERCPCGSGLKYKKCCLKHRRNPWKFKQWKADQQKEKPALINLNKKKS